MRYSKTQTIIVSEDDSNTPKQCRFGEQDQTTTETDLIKEISSNSANLPASVTFDIPFGAIGTAQWFYLYADKDLNVKFDSGPEMTLKANKPHEMWLQHTKLEVVTSDVTRLTYAIGGTD